MSHALVLALLALTALHAQTRQVAYPGAPFGGGTPIPLLQRGYLLFLETPCQVTVFQPSGRQAFSKHLQGPGGTPCSVASAAVDTDSMIAVSISYSAPIGYAAGILLLDASGAPSGFIDTGRYLPSHITFDHNHNLWAIGWQRDEIQNAIADTKDYHIARKYARSGKELAALLPRSTWGRKSAPADASRGYWTIALAKDRIGAIMNPNHINVTPEWIEWDFDGKLLSRTPIPQPMDHGRAYAASGTLYAGIYDRAQQTVCLSVLDRETKTWQPVAPPQPAREWKLLLGADGDELVFHSASDPNLTWLRP